MLVLSKYSVKAIAQFPKQKTLALSVSDTNFILFAHGMITLFPAALCVALHCQAAWERA